MKKQLVIVGIIVLLVAVGFSIYFLYPGKKNTNSSTIPYIVYDSRLSGTWINKSVNETIEYPLSWYTFYSNGTCLTSKGTFYWYIKTYHDNNYLNWSLHLESSVFNDIYSYSFSNNNNTLNLKRHIFAYGTNSNWNITTKFYNKLNETLSVEEVIQNSELYLARYPFDGDKWFDVTVVGYYNSANKGLVSSLYSSYMLTIHVDNVSLFSLLRDGVKYYCKGILRDYYETPLGNDFVLDVENIIEI